MSIPKNFGDSKKFVLYKETQNLITHDNINRIITLHVKDENDKSYPLLNIESLCFDISSLLEKGKSNISVTTNIVNNDRYFSVYCFLMWKIKYSKTYSYFIKVENENTLTFKINNYNCLEISTDGDKIYIRNNEKKQTLKMTPIEDDFKKFNKILLFYLKNNSTRLRDHFNLFGDLDYIGNYLYIDTNYFNICIDKLDDPSLIIAKNGVGKTFFLKYLRDYPNHLESNKSLYINESIVLSFGGDDDLCNHKLSLNQQQHNQSSNTSIDFFDSFMNIYIAHSSLSNLLNKGFVSKYIWEDINIELKNLELPFLLQPIPKGESSSSRLFFKIRDTNNLVYQNLSSGEKTLFVLIALFSFFKSNYQSEISSSSLSSTESSSSSIVSSTTNNRNKRVLLLLDEIETTLHAESLNKLFKIILNNQSNFHVVMSTHSATSLRISSDYTFKYYLLERDEKDKIIIEKIMSHENAINNVSGGMLSIVDNTKLVFVEDEDDRIFYSIVFDKIIDKKQKNFTKLVFCEGGSKTYDPKKLNEILKQLKSLDRKKNEMSIIDPIIEMVYSLKSSNTFGGTELVKRKVNLLSKRLVSNEEFRLGNSQIIGLLDGDDGKNKNLDHIITLEYYSFEMYLCFPFVLYFIILKLQSTNQANQDNINNNNNNNNSITEDKMLEIVIEFLKLKKNQTEKKEKQESIWIDRLNEFYENLEIKKQVELIGGKLVDIPIVFINGIGDKGKRGHYLFETLSRIFSLGKNTDDSLLKFKKETFNSYELFITENLIPLNLKETLLKVMNYSLPLKKYKSSSSSSSSLSPITTSTTTTTTTNTTIELKDNSPKLKSTKKLKLSLPITTTTNVKLTKLKSKKSKQNHNNNSNNNQPDENESNVSNLKRKRM